MPGLNRPTLLKTLVSLLAIALLTVAVACDGGDDGDGAPESDESPAADTPVAAPTERATEETPTPAEGEGDGDEVGGEGTEAELQALAGEWADKPAKVTYEFSSESNGQSDSGTMSLFWRPPDWRMDITSSGQGSSTIIAASNTNFFCSEQTCLSIEGVDSPFVPPFPFLGSFVQPNALSGDIADLTAGVDVDVSQETIAGESASCFSVGSDVAGTAGSVEWCFAQDGILLRLVSSAEGEFGSGTFSLEATEVSREVSDSDFEPPYEVTDLGDLDNFDME